MVAFTSDNIQTSATFQAFTSGKILSAHVANVLISAALGVLTSITVDSFPDKYRYH